MLHLQKHIRDALQKEFNKNTQGINFEVSLYNVLSDSLLMNEEDVENTYHTELKRYVPVVIQDIFGEYVPIENSTILEGNITSTLLVPTTYSDINEVLVDQNVETVLGALDEIRLNNQGRSIPIGNIRYEFDELNIDYEPSLLPSIYLKGELVNNGTILEFKGNPTYRIIKNITNITIQTIDQFGDTQFVLEPNYIGNDIEIFADINEERVRIRVESEETNISQFEFAFSQDYGINEGVTIFGDAIKLQELRMFNFNESSYNQDAFVDLETPIIEAIDKEKVNQIIISNIRNGENLSKRKPKFNYEYELTDLTNVFGDRGTMQIEFTVPNPSTNQFTYTNGINYQEFLLEWGLTYSDNVYNGNDVHYYLDGVRIYPTHRSTGLSNVQNATQKINALTSKSVNEENVLVKEFTIYYTNDEKVRELVEHIVNPELEQNKTWTLQEYYPSIPKKEYEVIIIDGGMSPTMNTPLSFSIELALAEDIL